MFNCKIKFTCIICNQKKNWYIMPMEEKTKSGDYKHSLNKYKITCKKCGMNYLLEFRIIPMEHKKGKIK